MKIGIEKARSSCGANRDREREREREESVHDKTLVNIFHRATGCNRPAGRRKMANS